jgi:hypothetical protein
MGGKKGSVCKRKKEEGPEEGNCQWFSIMVMIPPFPCSCLSRSSPPGLRFCEDGNRRYIQNIDANLPDYTMLNPLRL